MALWGIINSSKDYLLPLCGEVVKQRSTFPENSSLNISAPFFHQTFRYTVTYVSMRHDCSKMMRGRDQTKDSRKEKNKLTPYI